MMNLVKSTISGEFIPLEDRVQSEIKTIGYEVDADDLKDIRKFEKFVQFSIGTVEFGSPILITALIYKIMEYIMNKPNYEMFPKDHPYLIFTYGVLTMDGLCRIATGSGVVAEIRSLVKKCN